MSSTTTKAPTSPPPPPPPQQQQQKQRLQRIVNAASFHIEANPFLLSKSAPPEPNIPKKKQRRFKQNPRLSAPTFNTNQRQEQNDPSLDIVSSSNLLEGTVIYIDKNTVTDKDRLSSLAWALSATVIEKWTSSATHLIHGCPIPSQQTTRTPALVTKSLGHKMRVVAPSWLMDCYEQKKRMPETLYPYELNPNNRQNTLTTYSSSLLKSSDGQAVLVEDENPFGLAPEQCAMIESWSEDDDSLPDPLENNRRMTDYFQPTNNNNNDANNNDDHSGYNDVVDFDNTQDDTRQQQQQQQERQQQQQVNQNNENNNNNTYHGDGNGAGDDDNSMSYSLLEMSQAVPIGQLHENGFDASTHTKNHTAGPRKTLGHDTSPFHSPIASSAGRAMERMTHVYQGVRDQQEKRIKHEAWTTQECNMESVGPNIETSAYHDHGNDQHQEEEEDDQGHVLALSDLPDIDPSKLPTKILGREERLHIWYGEQSFCLDADLTRPNRRQHGRTGMTQNHPTPPAPSKRPATSTSKLTTIKSGPSKKIRDYY